MGRIRLFDRVGKCCNCDGFAIDLFLTLCNSASLHFMYSSIFTSILFPGNLIPKQLGSNYMLKRVIISITTIAKVMGPITLIASLSVIQPDNRTQSIMGLPDGQAVCIYNHYISLKVLSGQALMCSFAANYHHNSS